MKKLLIYSLLIACFESFISAAPCFCYRQKRASDITKINITLKDKKLYQDRIKTEIHPLEIFTFRYF